MVLSATDIDVSRPARADSTTSAFSPNLQQSQQHPLQVVSLSTDCSLCVHKGFGQWTLSSQLQGCNNSINEHTKPPPKLTVVLGSKIGGLGALSIRTQCYKKTSRYQGHL